MTSDACVVADAKKLAAKGAEVVAVDQTDAAALRAALDGAYGVFYVTVTLEIAVLQAEYEQGVCFRRHSGGTSTSLLGTMAKLDTGDACGLLSVT